MHRIFQVVVVMAILACAALPAAADGVTFGSATISVTDPNLITGATVTTTSDTWTLSLPNFNVDPFTTQTLDVTFNVSGSIDGINYAFNGLFDDFGVTTITEIFSNGATGSVNLTIPSDPTSGGVVFPTTSFFDVFFEITVNGGLNGSSLGSITQTAVPEPGSLILLASGLGALVLRRKRQA